MAQSILRSLLNLRPHIQKILGRDWHVDRLSQSDRLNQEQSLQRLQPSLEQLAGCGTMSQKRGPLDAHTYMTLPSLLLRGTVEERMSYLQLVIFRSSWGRTVSLGEGLEK